MRILRGAWPWLAVLVACGPSDEPHGYEQCVYDTSCLCSGAQTTAQATVTALSGTGATLRIDAVAGAPREYVTVGAEVSSPKLDFDRLGSRSLLLYAPASPTRRLPMESGEVICRDAHPDFRIDVAQAEEIILGSGACRQQEIEAGFRASCGYEETCASTGPVTLAWLLLAAWRRRRVAWRMRPPPRSE